MFSTNWANAIKHAKTGEAVRLTLYGILTEKIYVVHLFSANRNKTYEVGRGMLYGDKPLTKQNAMFDITPILKDFNENEVQIGFDITTEDGEAVDCDNYSIELVNYLYLCDCECHFIPGVLHFIECCDGVCPGCRKASVNLKEHYKACANFEAWKKKQKRKLLRRLGLL